MKVFRSFSPCLALSLAVSLAPCLGAGCGAPPADDSDSVGMTGPEAIQGGAVDSGDPAVGLVWIAGGGFCTGTLIAPDVVLTAGHCVATQVAGFYTGEGAGTTVVGTHPGAGFTAHPVIDQVAYPKYRSESRCPNTTFDVALLRLAKPITNIQPLALATTMPRPGDTCRAVGYGVHDSATTETVEQRRDATEEVLGLVATAVHVGWQSGVVDHGDSGGPLLCGAKIAGTTSCGTDGTGPGHTEAWYGRVDAVEPWIKSVITTWK